MSETGKLPPAVWVIGFGIFAQGTSELMLAGLLPELASDLGVSIPLAGLLVSAFALGMLVGAPVLAVATLRWPRRRALLVFLAVFAVTHVVSALADDYGLLFAMRFVGAFAYAGFWAVGASTAMALAGPERRGRAMSVVAGGLTVATAIGLPAGTWIGQNLGWRGAFWAVAALTVIAGVVVVASVPALKQERPGGVLSEVRGLRPGRLWLSYAMTAVVTSALLGTFSYLTAWLIQTTGIDPAWVPLILLGYGVGAVTGTALGGRAADHAPRATLGAGFAALVLVSVALAIAAAEAIPVIVLVIAIGFAGFFTNPALNSRVAALAPAAPTLAVALNTSAFNLGIAVGPWLGGLALAGGHGYPAIAWIGAGLAALGLLVWLVDLRLAGERHASVSAVGAHQRMRTRS